MTVVIAMDSFKGSISSLEAGMSASDGIRRVYPDAEIYVRPIADGGEGTVKALAAGCGGSFCRVCVTGPLGRKVKCEYGIIKSTKTAIIEMSAAAGITLIPEHNLNPLYTTTYGVGEMIADAIKKGCRHFIIGIGGSATNDGGTGMLQALGFGLLDRNQKQIRRGAIGLSDLAEITTDKVIPHLNECTFRIACDVTNPLCGDYGCSATFGPQKGADSEMILQMDKWLSDYAELVTGIFPEADPDTPGAGAAGGLGFAFSSFLNSSLESGVKIILEETHLQDYIKNADIVITGEGCLDGQTVMGKAPIGVARLAKQFKKPVLAFSGCVTRDATSCNLAGIDAFFPISRSIIPIEKALKPVIAMQNMSDTVEQVFRAISIFYNQPK